MLDKDLLLCTPISKGHKKRLERLERYQATKDDTEEFNGGDINTRKHAKDRLARY